MKFLKPTINRQIRKLNCQKQMEDSANQIKTLFECFMATTITRVKNPKTADDVFNTDSYF